MEPIGCCVGMAQWGNLLALAHPLMMLMILSPSFRNGSESFENMAHDPRISTRNRPLVQRKVKTQGTLPREGPFSVSGR